MTFDAFLSHATPDKPRVRELKAQLEAAGLSCWLDEDELRPGFPWMARLKEGIARSRAIVVCAGSAGVGQWEDEEVQHALQQVKQDGRPLVPVVLPDAPDTLEWPAFVDNRTWVSFRHGWSPGELDRLIWGITGKKARARPERRPDNLPRLPHFFGREKELDTVLAALDPDERSWGALIDGPGGMGKTALAIRAAERAPTDWFRRVVFVTAKVRDLRADGAVPLDDGARSWDELIGGVATELGVEQVSRIGLADRLAPVRTLLKAGPTLLVLDNLESLPDADRQRVYLFLEKLPAGCKAIVTSRRRTDVGARVVRLDRLEQGAALAWLAELGRDNAELAKASATDREAAYAQTNGNPLLLRWLVGQLGRGKCRTLPKAVAFLTAAPPENDPLEYVFGDLAAAFTPDETKVLGALTHFTEPIGVQHIAALAGVSRSAAQTALEDLAGRALVAGDAEDRAFALTALVAVYLRRARPDAVAASGDRLTDRVYALVVENGGEKFARYGAIEAEWALLAAAMERLLAGDNRRLQTVCDALRLPLEHLGRWGEQAAWWGRAELRAQEAGDARRAGWRAFQAGFALVSLGDGAGCLAAAERAAGHWAEAPAREQALAVRLRGVARQRLGDHAAARRDYEAVLAVVRAINPGSADVGASLSDLARLDRAAGDLSAAERRYREALVIDERLDQARFAATDRADLAGLLHDLGRPAEAEPFARAVVVDPAARRSVVAHAHLTLAQVHLGRGDLDAAHDAAHACVTIRAALRDPDLPSFEATLAEIRAAQAARKPPDSS